MSPGALNVDPSISSGNFQFDESGCAIEARFEDLCKSGLSIDGEIWKEAMRLLRESRHLLQANMSANENEAQVIERLWFAHIIFSAKILSQVEDVKQENQDSGFSLSQILKAFKINIDDFFKEMPQFVLKASQILNKLYGSDWEKRFKAKELLENFEHLSFLSKFYKSAFQEFFLTTDANDSKHPAVTSGTDHVYNYQRFGWLLFLALRIHAFDHLKDLVTCTNGLVSILAILILHVPVCFRKNSLCDYPLFVGKGDKGVDLIASLCNIYHTSQDELRRIMEKTNNLMVNILNKKPCLASECKSENLDNLNADGLTYFEDLTEGQSLAVSLLILEKDYAGSIRNEAELDERVFVNGEDNLFGTGSLSGGIINVGGTKRKFDVMASPTKTIASALSPPCSPASRVNGGFVGNNFKMAPTMVRTAMAAAKWLRTVISSCPSKPTAELEHFLSSCDRDLTNYVSHRANIILEAIFPSKTLGEWCVGGSLLSANLMDSIWPEERRMETLKLYYRVLEAICMAEYRKLHGGNLTPLLSNERFHRCMLACSAELVLASYMPVTMFFPAVLDKTGITAFDLSKVIESFVIHEETLPRQLRMHLNSLEERLLESMAWEKGSSMYNSLIVVKPVLSAEINRLRLLAEPMPSLDAIAMHQNISIGVLPSPTFQKHALPPDKNGDVRSPERVNGDYRSVLVERGSFTSPVKNTLQSAFVSPTQPSPSGRREPFFEIGINVFFTKIMKLASVRIKTLCQRLQLSEQFWESVRCLVQQILKERTSIFFNRHIDQLILCSFYMVAKYSELSLTFKEISGNYRKQPQCKPHVLENVFVDCSSRMHNKRTGPEHVDIMTFYNEIFVFAVKPFLVELDPFGSLTNRKVHEEKNNLDGQFPGSPKLSLFPSLPDMSPKKVSASHNVYVSSIQSSKMDSLFSCSSRSYYACIGKSTHPYQSPSKDLSAINDRLNCRKAVRRLIVDDIELVFPQIESRASSSIAAAATFNSPLKYEQSNL